MSEEPKAPWESAAVREQLGIESVWFANAADGIKADEFQPEVPAYHPLRGLTLCHLVMRDAPHSVVTGTWNSYVPNTREMAWADAVSQI